MKVTKFAGEQSNAANKSGSKELVGYWKLISFDPTSKRFADVVDMRLWMGRSKNASVIDCAVWVYTDNIHTSGRGNAGGYGYCKASSAACSALESAGFTFDEHWEGAGENKIREALEAIGEFFGLPHCHVTYGS